MENSDQAPKRGPGRPKLPEGEARSESVSASVTPLEREALKAKAKALGKPLASMARDALLALLLGACAAILPGCGASVPTVVSVATVAVQATCGGATKLCEAMDPACGSGACHVAHDVCQALPISASVQIACEPASS